MHEPIEHMVLFGWATRAIPSVFGVKPYMSFSAPVISHGPNPKLEVEISRQNSSMSMDHFITRSQCDVLSGRKYRMEFEFGNVELEYAKPA